MIWYHAHLIRELNNFSRMQVVLSPAMDRRERTVPSMYVGIEAWHVIVAIFVFFGLSPTMTMITATITSRAFKRMDLIESASGLAGLSVIAGFSFLGLLLLAGGGKTNEYNASFWFMPFIMSGFVFSLLAFVKIEKIHRTSLESSSKAQDPDSFD